MRRQGRKFRPARFAAMLLAGVLLLGPAALVRADTYDDLTNQYNSLQKNLNDGQKKQKQVTSAIKTTEQQKTQKLTEKQQIDQNITIVKQQLDILNTQISDAQQQIDDTTGKITTTEATIAEDTDRYKARMVRMFEAGNVSYMSLLLSSKTPADFLARFEIIRTISEHDNNLLAKLKSDKADLENLKAVQVDAKAKLDDRLAEQQKKQADLNSQSYQSAVKIEELKKLGTVLTNQQNDLEQQSEQLEDNMEDASNAIEEFLRTHPSSDLKFSGAFVWPVLGGKVSCPFGGYAGHTGTDIIGTSGVTDIRCSASGTVIKVGVWDTSIPRSSAGYGNFVLVDNGKDASGNSISTLYGHMYGGTIRVKVGDYITQRQVIGKMGNSGNVRSGGKSPAISDLVTGAHLHFEIRINGKPVNAQLYVNSSMN